jgi:non-homologous end joining protein Ku
VIDLMDALKQSVAQAQKDKGKPAAAKPKKKASTGRKRAAAR